MELNLHANATTTPRIRAYIQRCTRSVTQLAAELGVSETTIRRWRERTSVSDRSHTPKILATSFSPLEEALVCELRTRLQLPLDDITEVMRRCLNPKLSRSAIHRCLVRHGLNRRAKPDKPAIGTFERATVGFIHIDLKHLPALERRKSYAFVAIDRATRYVYLESHPRRDGDTAAGFLKRFLVHFPHRVHTILTDNGSEFTDRFAVDMKDKPHDRPSGRHPFDRVCAKRKIDHRLIRPYRPQTNGLVERFNRRLVEAIGRQPKRGIAHRLFVSHADRDAFLNRFVHDYNRTRLKYGLVHPIVSRWHATSVVRCWTALGQATEAHSSVSATSRPSKRSTIPRDQTLSRGRAESHRVSTAHSRASGNPACHPNRDSPDDSRTGVNISAFPVSLEDRREVRTPTGTLGQPER